jgi:AAA+ ATPase superfamily predicted ATPase
MNYFPTALASGNAFCNRKQELKRLQYNLKNIMPTLLVSPRRYGKTSLSLKAFEQIKWPYAHIDLYKALSEEDISRFILNGIGQVLGQIENTPAKLIKVASEFFAGFQIKFVIEKFGLAVELGRKNKKAIDTMLAALEKLDLHAKKKNKKVIIYLDEFQVVGEIAKNTAIEAAIREAVQKASHVAYVFSGSNRHLVEEMFNDKKRPFYKLCDAIPLGRIDETEYKDYINHAAKVKWKKHLNDDVLAAIFKYTERHPYYINKLCSLLWQQGVLPSEKEAENTWENYINENKSGIERELSLLSLNQRKLLIYLSNDNSVMEPFSKQYSTGWDMSATSIHRAMESLLEKDYVFLDEGKYSILDPLIKGALQ